MNDFARAVLVLALLLTAVSLMAEEEAVKKHPDFVQAQKLYFSAPSNNYDFGPAIQSFEKIAAHSFDKETRLKARYYLVLCQLSSASLHSAYGEALKLYRSAKWLYPSGTRVRVAGEILELAKGKKLSSSADLRNAVLEQSMLKPFPAESEKERLLKATETVEALDWMDLCYQMRGAETIYRKASEEVGELKSKMEKATAEEKESLKVVLQVLEENLSKSEAAKEGFDQDNFLATIGVTGLLSDLISSDKGKIEDVLKASICANNLRQVGLAFQMYMADNRGYFPPLRPVVGSTTKEEITWCGLLMPYLGMKREVKLIGGWSAAGPELLEALPRDCVFLCPARQHSWVTAATRGAEYGYVGYLCSDPGGKERKVKFSQIQPSKQVILAEVQWGFTLNGPLSFAHDGLANFLYADGHVETHNEQWLSTHRTDAPPGDNNPWNTVR